MNVVIAGAGAVGRSIAQELLRGGHRVTLLERRLDHIDPTVAPSATWMHGDACELELLEEAGLQDYEVVIAATGDDKANLVFSLLAKTEFGVRRVVARVNDPRNEWLFDGSWGVDVAVSTPRLLASLAEEAVSVGDLVRLMTLRQGQANLVEITLPTDTALAGRAVRTLSLPRDVALVTILRGGRVIVPQPDDPLEGEDELLFVSTVEAEDELRRSLATEPAGAAPTGAEPPASI
ncbi:trk system potassium uptake protein TrkA [Nocardia kruczakiae]|uniref:Trk system potassium uptake protein TrkA n=1 Tax=Nocardia kruczakiae TaxID=261477 RepID=A0ABU1XP30_9NOCA|nr:TrkA family potassium uptake protein [Nocardia kruczakiae]MDR7172313.1 trk system potassium uptake protein TrkA [Nocardia kruczakiae]